MVWIKFGGNRRPGWGGGYGGYGGGYGRGYGGGYGRGGGGGGGCLRDLLFLDAGCCLAEALGCGPQLVLLAPSIGMLLLRGPATGRSGSERRGTEGSGTESRAIALVRLYQERISARRARPVCRMDPSCSHYAIEVLQAHGTARALPMIAARLWRCRP